MPCGATKSLEGIPYPVPEPADASCCGELEDRLLEGALENLSYFPQLMREIHQIKQGIVYDPVHK